MSILQISLYYLAFLYQIKIRNKIFAGNIFCIQSVKKLPCVRSLCLEEKIFR